MSSAPRASHWPLLFAFVVAALALGSPARAEAQSEDERAAARLFRAGSAAFEAGDYPAAANAFEEAHRRVARGAAAYNAALAWEGAKDLPRAADRYELALADPRLGPVAAADAKKRLALLEARLGVVRILEVAGGSVTLEHVVGATTPRRVHLAPGPHDVVVRYESGKVERATVAVEAGETVALGFPPDKVRSLPTVADAPPPRRSNTLRSLGWIGIGGAVAFAGAGAVLGVKALGAKDDYDASSHTDEGARDEAATLRTWTNVAWAGAAAFGIAGAVLIMTAPRSGSNSQTSLRAGPTFVGLAGSF